jgi:ketosteroid isomerase-like protein
MFSSLSPAYATALRTTYAKMNRGDIDAFVATLDPTIRWLTVDLRLQPRALIGRDAVAAFFRELLEPLDEYRADPERIVAFSDRVVVLVRQRGRARGREQETEVRLAHVWTMRPPARIVGFRIYLDPERALSAMRRRERAASPV